MHLSIIQAVEPGISFLHCRWLVADMDEPSMKFKYCEQTFLKVQRDLTGWRDLLANNTSV